MATSSQPISRSETQPSLLRDRAFWGLNLTQFLGAFNDNLFKQLVMVLCLTRKGQGSFDLQGVAMILFAVPFIAISGYAGYLSDRYSKRTIIVLCKVAEVAIVSLGMIGFYLESLPFLLGVLCLMGVHSAFFGPSKYGILPEMLRAEDLPRANGMMLMATFLSIIFGLSAAGFAMHQFSARLWLASLPCLIVAVSGFASSLTIRPTPIAQPLLKFELSSLAVAPETRQLLLTNRSLLGVLLMSSVFWFVGGTIYPPAINALCEKQFHFNHQTSGIFAATTGLGIAIGCVVAGILSKDRVRGWIVRMGACGLTASLLLLALPGPGWNMVRDEIRHSKLVGHAKIDEPPSVASAPVTEPDAASDNAHPEDVKPERVAAAATPTATTTERYYRGTLLGPVGVIVGLISVGLFAGFYSVPLQVYLQSAAPTDQKGRIIGANNLMNWIGIACAGGIYTLGHLILVDWLLLPQSSLFGFAALLMLPVALFYRPPDGKIQTQ